MDTNRRANEPGPAEDYLRYFTEHFTDTEWETIKRQVFRIRHTYVRTRVMLPQNGVVLGPNYFWLAGGFQIS